MGILLMIRHGESESNVLKIMTDDLEKYPLTSNGVMQAKSVAQEISEFKFDSLYSSPVLRARETAGIISGSLSVDVQINNDIRETSMGGLNGLTSREAREKIGQGERYESWESHLERVSNFMKGVRGRVVAVSHAMPIRVMVSEVLDLDEIESRGIEIPNASITALDIDKMKVLCIGSSTVSERLRKMLTQ
jgi:probable phosphoglycerate mutase